MARLPRTFAAALSAIALAYGPPARAAWDVQVTQNPLTDESRGVAILKGDQGLLGGKCDGHGKGSLYLQVVSYSYLGEGRNNGDREILFRVESGEVQSITG